MANLKRKIYTNDYEILDLIKENKNEFIGKNQSECLKILGYKGRFNSSCLVAKAFNRFSEIGLQLQKSGRCSIIRQLSDDISQSKPNFKLIRPELKSQIKEEIIVDLDILTQTENNFHKMGEAIMDMLNICSKTFTEIQQLKQNNIEVSNILKEKEDKIKEIEFRLAKNNNLTQNWFHKYEEMKQKFYEK